MNKNKIEGFLTILKEEVVEEEVVVIEIIQGTITKTPKLSAKEWLLTSNMNIKIIVEAKIILVAAEVVADETIVIIEIT